MQPLHAAQSIQSARLSFQSPELGPPLTRKGVAPPPLGTKGGDTLAWEAGGGVPNTDEGTDTQVLYVYYNTSTVSSIDL
jgi:hypothetical protein